jgi:hypothetical protein
VNKDFEIFARDSLTSNKLEMRELIEVKLHGDQAPEHLALYNHRCEEIYNVLRKLRREASGFLTKHDKEVLEDLQKNLRSYLRHVHVYEMIKGMYDKRQLEIKERERTNNGIIRLDKVTDRDLEDAGVSKREFDNIKVLLAVDEEMFKPSEWGAFSNYSQFVDLTKYQDKKLSKEVKDILYRPPKLKNLYLKYWQLAKVCEGMERTEHDKEILKDHRPRFPRKSADEVNLIEGLFATLVRMIEEDRRNYKPTQAASTQLMTELDHNVQ